jgi:hypothetical protein
VILFLLHRSASPIIGPRLFFSLAHGDLPPVAPFYALSTKREDRQSPSFSSRYASNPVSHVTLNRETPASNDHRESPAELGFCLHPLDSPFVAASTWMKTVFIAVPM